MTRLLLLAPMLLAMPAYAQTEPPRVGRDSNRLDVPGVITPPRPPQRIETPFAAAYRRAGQPRLALFFNRDLSDVTRADVTVRRTEREESASRTARADSLSGTPPSASAKTGLIETPGQGDRRLEDRSDRQTERQVAVTVERPRQQARPALLDEAAQWKFEAAFNAQLATERVRMVDRAIAMRIAAPAAATDDPQRLETAAIRAHADLAVLIRAVAGSNGTRHVFRVTALDTRSASILADEVVELPADDAASAGTVVGEALMRRLQAAWTPPRL